eukprot:2540088-Pleurochrysis_carterae.AAC.3
MAALTKAGALITIALGTYITETSITVLVILRRALGSWAESTKVERFLGYRMRRQSTLDEGCSAMTESFPVPPRGDYNFVEKVYNILDFQDHSCCITLDRRTIVSSLLRAAQRETRPRATK